MDIYLKKKGGSLLKNRKKIKTLKLSCTMKYQIRIYRKFAWLTVISFLFYESCNHATSKQCIAHSQFPLLLREPIVQWLHLKISMKLLTNPYASHVYNTMKEILTFAKKWNNKKRRMKTIFHHWSSNAISNCVRKNFFMTYGSPQLEKESPTRRKRESFVDMLKIKSNLSFP